MKVLKCEMGELCGTAGTPCENPVTHLGEKGWVYCGRGARRRSGVERTRRLTAEEVATLHEGKPLAKF